MNKLYLVGIHDLFHIDLHPLKKEPYFSPGNFYLIEISFDKETIYSYQNIQSKKDLEDLLLKGHAHEIAIKNISQLIDFKPYGFLPCATRTLPEPEVYGSRRDREIMKLVKVAVDGLNKRGFEGNIVFFGGSKHAKYMARELDYPSKELVNLIPFQAKQEPYLNLLLSISKRQSAK